MANLSITNECNRSCRYCFARTASKAQISNTPHMPLPTFQQALDFLGRSGIDQVRLLGGEPTLHPDFPALIAQVMQRKLSLLVFSNGIMPKSALDCLGKVPADRLSVLINIGRPDDISLEEQTRQIETLKQLGSRVILGVNIDSPAVQCAFLFESIERYRLSRTVRLGLAHPILNGGNYFLPPHYYSIVGQKILDVVVQAQAAEVHVEFDCGFVPCIFPPDGLEILGDSVKQLGTRCNPILDILPDGQVISCYPLANLHHEVLPETKDAAWLRKQFEKRLEPYRSLGIFKECAVCGFRKNGMCVGGCLSAAMQRLRQDDFTFTLPSLTPPRKGICPVEREGLLKDDPIERKGRAKWVIPYIDQPLPFWEELADNYAQHIKEVYVPLPGELLGSGRPSQPAEYLDSFLCHSPFALSVLINPIVLPRPVDECAPQIIEILKKIINECHITGIAISDLLLAEQLHDAFPEIPLTASVLMDISQPNQVLMLREIFQHLVPSSRIMRNLKALKTLKEAFPGKLRLVVNEACLPNCPFRVQHFYEMGTQTEHPHSLCERLLQAFPWMRLTGAWVLPQHLHLYNGIYDELKLAGRVTLADPKKYRRVLDAYLHRTPLLPNEIGGGPASMFEPIDIDEEFFAQTLQCGTQCHACVICREYWECTSEKNT